MPRKKGVKRKAPAAHRPSPEDVGYDYLRHGPIGNPAQLTDLVKHYARNPFSNLKWVPQYILDPLYDRDPQEVERINAEDRGKPMLTLMKQFTDLDLLAESRGLSRVQLAAAYLDGMKHLEYGDRRGGPKIQIANGLSGSGLFEGIYPATSGARAYHGSAPKYSNPLLQKNSLDVQAVNKVAQVASDVYNNPVTQAVLSHIPYVSQANDVVNLAQKIGKSGGPGLSDIGSAFTLGQTLAGGGACPECVHPACEDCRAHMMSGGARKPGPDFKQKKREDSRRHYARNRDRERERRRLYEERKRRQEEQAALDRVLFEDLPPLEEGNFLLNDLVGPSEEKVEVLEELPALERVPVDVQALEHKLDLDQRVLANMRERENKRVAIKNFMEGLGMTYKQAAAFYKKELTRENRLRQQGQGGGMLRRSHHYLNNGPLPIAPLRTIFEDYALDSLNWVDPEVVEWMQENDPRQLRVVRGMGGATAKDVARNQATALYAAVMNAGRFDLGNKVKTGASMQFGLRHVNNHFVELGGTGYYPRRTASRKIRINMREFKRGNNPKIKSRKQAIAIGISQARQLCKKNRKFCK
jgi:hypothetical protein